MSIKYDIFLINMNVISKIVEVKIIIFNFIEYSDLKKHITEMGATMTIVGGETQGRMSNESDFNLFENVK